MLPRTEAGRPFELVPVGEHFLVLPPEPRPWRPRVTVDGAPWTVVDSLQGLRAGQAPAAYAFHPGLNAVAFGARTADGQRPDR